MSSAVKQLCVNYQPCVRCAAKWLLQFDDAEVKWSFVWNSDKAVQNVARRDRAAAIDDLWG